MMGDMKRLAVIFPGMGYHADKPLLYYSKKLMMQYGYEIIQIPYGDVLGRFKGDMDEEKKADALRADMDKAEEYLRNIRWEDYDKLLFVSKSIGTVVAAAYAKRHQLETDNIFFTPLEETFQFVEQKGIVFHGTADPMARTPEVRRFCQEKGLLLFIVENGNHSLETGRAAKDLEHLLSIMEQAERYIQEDL